MNKLYLLLFYFFISFNSFSQNFASFTQVGPVKFPANPSVQTTGMGRVSQLVYHPTDSNVIFAVTASGGVFKSSNEAATWRPISDFLPQTPCASLAINPLKPNTMYLGTGDANYNSAGLGVWKTIDGGTSWYQSTTGLGNKLVSYIRIAPNDTGTLIAACRDGIYKSTNSGTTWVKKTTVNASYRDLYYRPQSNNILYAATDAFFYRSYDNGETWSQSDINSNITCAGIKIAVCESDTSKLYCVVWKNGGTSPFGGVYKSINNGASFTLQVDTPNVLGYSSNGTSMDGQGAYNLAIAADPTNSNIIYVAGICVWKSTNQGAAFSLKSPWAFGVHADKHGFLFSPYNPSKLFIYHDGGLDRTTDGGDNWTTLEDGLSASEFYKMGSSGLYNDHIIGGLQDNGMDVATNKKFSTVRGGDWGGDFAFDAFDSSMLYENGGLKRNIITHATGSINGKDGIYAVHPKDSNVMFEITTNLFRTKNLRATPSTNVAWTQISSISGNTGPRSLAFSKATYGTLYIAFNPQSFYKTNDVNTVTPTFTKITSFPFNNGEQIKQLETCDYDSNVVFVLTTYSRIFRSGDKGNTWSSLNLNLPATTIIKFHLNQKSTDSSMYVATAFAVYHRTRYLTNWTSYSHGLPTVAQISDMEISNDGSPSSRLHISTYGRGIWQTDLFKSPTIAPIADFTLQPSSSQSCPNTIIAVDNSTCAPVSRQWKITPTTGWNYVNGTDSLSLRPEIKFNTTGIYFISLTVVNTKGTDTKTINYNYSNLNIAPTCSTTTNLLGGYTIGIYRFEFNTIDNSSSTGNVSYQDFSCAANTVVRAGGTYTAWVTNGNSYNENSKIYIDLNNNGIFTDANELVGTISNGLGRRSCSITIPINPPLLNRFLRMRVVSDYNTVTGPCGVLSYGQCEDYAIFIDKTRPIVTINIPKPIVSNSFEAIFSSNEVLYGFDASDLGIGNATINNFTQIDPFTYSAQIIPIDNAKVNVNINANGFSDIAGNTNNAFSDSTTFFLGMKSFTISGVSIKDSITQTATGGSILSYVPFGTQLDSLVPTFTVSDSSNTYIGAVSQVSGSSKNNFNGVVNYTIKSSDNSLSKTYPVNIITNKNTECKLLTFGFVTPAVTGTITQNATGGIVDLTVPFGTPLSNLIGVFTLSDSAKAYISLVRQTSGLTANNFTNFITYKIVAQDTNFSKTYLINIVFGKSKSCDIITYALQTPAINGLITPTGNTGGTIAITVPYGTNLNILVAIFTLSDSAKAFIGTVKQTSGVNSNNYSTTISYKIIAQDTNFSKIYFVTVAIAPNTAANLLSYNLVSPAATGIITNTSFGGLVNLTVPFATNINNLVAQFTLSDSAKAFVNNVIQVSTNTSNNYTDTLFVIVKAQDGVTSKLYKIIVKITPNTQCDLLSYKFNNPNVTGIITSTFNGGTVEVLVPFNTNIVNLIAEFTVSDSSKVSINGVPQMSTITSNNFTNPLNYLVKAQNNINSKTYAVTVTKNTGIALSSGNSLFRIYPNPAKDELLIVDYQNLDSGARFKIVNTIGQTILEGQLKDKETKLDISTLAAGIYYFQLNTHDGVINNKFVKE